MNRYRIPIYLSVFLFLFISCSVIDSDSFVPKNPTIEYLANPLGLDTAAPRFSWTVQAGERGASQSAYQIIVSGDRASIQNGEGESWDTGKVSSEQSLNIHYNGEKLESGSRYYWRVRIWDQNDDQSPWSEIQTFQMGMLSPDDWTAEWITNPDTMVSAPLLRNEFSLDKPVASAYAYVSGMGYYELYLNGEKVGNNVLDPAITDYRKRALYETYEVTEILESGANAIGLMLGNGGFRVRHTEGRWVWNSTNHAFGTPSGLVQLQINYEDGTRDWVYSNNTWKTSQSPINYNNVYGGEDYDARLEQEGWNATGFDDSTWDDVLVADYPDVMMDSQLMPAIRVTETIEPVARTQPSPDTYLFDLGQNFPGWWRIRVEGERGIQLKIRGSETLNDSLFPTPLMPGDSLNTENEYHRNVWTSYTLKGEETETYEPRFFYTGYRYVEVKVDDPGGLASLEVEGRVVHSDLERNGQFSSSDTLLNGIYEAAIWSQRGNLHGYPTDCPHREKGGYNGDGQVIAEASMHDFHMHSMYAKWLNDMRDAQQENGRIPNTSPTILGGYGGGIAWGSAYILIPSWMHSYYGDRRILEEHYDSMKRYMEYLHNLASENDEHPEESYIINEFGGYWDSLGEWEAPVGGRTGPINPLTNTYYWYLNARTFAGIAEELGRDEDRSRYLALADTIKSAINDNYFNPETNLYGPDEIYQGYQLFALGGDLVPEGRRQAVMDNLVRDIMVTRDGHLGTGILGTKHLFKVLADAGREDVIHEVVTKKTYPSWGYWLANGATTLWESWDGESSHNHQMFGSVNEYLYKYLAGIRAPTDEGTSAGYKEIHIQPYVPEGLEHAEASVQTVRGTVSSTWLQRDDQLQLEVSLPANTTGRVSIPTLGGENLTVTESGRLIWENGSFRNGVNGIIDGDNDGDYIIFQIESGSYEFRLNSGG